MNKFKSFTDYFLSIAEREIKYYILSKLTSSKNGLYFSDIQSEKYDFLKFFTVLMSLQDKELIERDKISRKYIITQKGLEELEKTKQT